MSESKNIPVTTIARLPIYLRCLQEIKRKDIEYISSFGLAELSGRNAAQLRKDLSYLGEFGTRGVGYSVDDLIDHISKWLGVSTVRAVFIIGVGHLGQALCKYQGFAEKGFAVTGVFDVDPGKIGRTVGGLEIKHVSKLAEAEPADIGIITTPAAAAQEAASLLEACGVKAILNLAPVNIEAEGDTLIRHVDLASELQIIGFHLANVEEEEKLPRYPD